MKGAFIVAVHALVYLKHHPRPVSSEELADNVCTNPARIRKVMSALCKSGLAVSHAGAVGGYEVGEKGGAVTLLEILEAGGETAIKAPWRSGDLHKDCQISSGIAGVMDTIFDDMDGLCRDYLATRTIDDIEADLFNDARTEETEAVS